MTRYQLEFEMHGLRCSPHLKLDICTFDAVSDEAAITHAAQVVRQTDMIVDVVRLNDKCGGIVWESRNENR